MYCSTSNARGRARARVRIADGITTWAAGREQGAEDGGGGVRLLDVNSIHHGPDLVGGGADDAVHGAPLPPATRPPTPTEATAQCASDCGVLRERASRGEGWSLFADHPLAEIFFIFLIPP